MASRNIPSLDGLRAVSVGIVIIGHENVDLLTRLVPKGLFRNGPLGVNIFFVISGFLITHLMLHEQDKYGTLSLRNFYIRRSFRIFPAFYAYLVVIAITSLCHLYPVNWKFFLGAATYTLNYFPQFIPWVIAHSWSLCVEEQFYILWPACIAFLPRRTCLRLAGLIILLSPLVRTATYLIDRRSLSYMDFMSYTRADALMVGCFIALAISLKEHTRTLQLLKLPIVAALATLNLILLSPHYPNRFRESFGLGVDAICGGILILYGISHAESPVGRVLNNRVVKHIGLISYSLYLWQQLFTGPNTHYALWNLLAIFACAEASFWLVERPCLRIRDRFVKQTPAATPSDDISFVKSIEAI